MEWKQKRRGTVVAKPEEPVNPRTLQVKRWRRNEPAGKAA